MQCDRLMLMVGLSFFFFFFKQKTAYEILYCDWSSDVCSSDLIGHTGAFNDQTVELNIALVEIVQQVD